MRQLLCLLLCGTLFANLNACGWHLRGAIGGLEELGSIWVRGGDLGNKLTQALSNNKATLATSSSRADYVIHLSGHHQERRIVAYGNNGSAEEYAINEEVQVQIFSHGETAGQVRLLQVERSYNFDPDNLLSKNQEEQQLKEEIQRDLIRQIIMLIQAHSNKLETKAEPESGANKSDLQREDLSPSAPEPAPDETM